jgi:hypothetical protein
LTTSNLGPLEKLSTILHKDPDAFAVHYCAGLQL